MKLRVKVKQPRIAYPGSTIQQTYAEDIKHGYLLWDITNKDIKASFHTLPNTKPFINITWKGSVSATIEDVKTINAIGARYRVCSDSFLHHKDVLQITEHLKEKFSAAEVTFKSNKDYVAGVLSAGQTVVGRKDLRNVDVLLKLLKQYHNDVTLSSSEEEAMNDLIKQCVSQLSSNDVVRNTQWSLRELQFDNTYGYGEGNKINFDSLNGIVGIFGPNRHGKSSIVGTIMYALFNGSDRGSIKNLHIINARKQHCYAKAILNINSESYVVERQTVKNENKKGINASTHLNVFRYNNESKRFDDLAGEGRTDTEKVLRGLIGSSEDFLLTTMSVQNENNQFLGHGSAKRKQTLFRFLDLEIFDTMHDFAKSEMNILKSNLKNFSVVVDYDKLIYDLKDNLSKASIQVSSISDSLQKLQSELFDVESTIKVLNSSADVKDVDVISLKNVINDISNSINSQNIVLKSKQLELQKLNSTLSETVVSDDELTMLKQGVEQYEALKSTTSLHKNKLDQLSNTLKQHRNSLQLLNSVPCGDSFPECKFIHNAHLDKNNIVTTTNEFEEVKALFEQSHNLMLKMAEFQYDLKLSDRLKKIAVHNQTKSNITLAEKFVENTELQIQNLQLRLKQSEEKYEKIKSHNESEFHAKLKACTDERDRILKDIKSKDALRIKLAEDIGRMNSTLCSMIEEKNLKESLVNKLKIYELAVVAFSKKGIPSLIVESQLPIINEEISKILHGIVDFTVSLELDKESDSLEIYIDYFDSKRLIELGSGMEKMIASVAIRVALTNVSTLPKTDMFVIDEGFGALDEMSVEACNRFLVSLKRYFKTILLITHVDGVKDIVDSMIEIVKSEKDSKVLYE